MAITREVEKNLTIDESNAKLVKTKMIPHKNGLFYDESTNITRYDYNVGYNTSNPYTFA
jgi:hypothetical protein